MNPTDRSSINVAPTVINAVFSGGWDDIKQEATRYLNKFL
jgi:hypothetical protein